MISLEKGKKLVERMEEENCLKQSEINTINQKVNRIQQNYENKLKDVNKLRDDTKRINKEKKGEQKRLRARSKTRKPRKSRKFCYPKKIENSEIRKLGIIFPRFPRFPSFRFATFLFSFLIFFLFYKSFFYIFILHL